MQIGITAFKPRLDSGLIGPKTNSWRYMELGARVLAICGRTSSPAPTGCLWTFTGFSQLLSGSGLDAVLRFPRALYVHGASIRSRPNSISSKLVIRSRFLSQNRRESRIAQDSDGIAVNWVYFGCFCDVLSLFGSYSNWLSWWILLWQLLTDSDGIFYGEE